MNVLKLKQLLLDRGWSQTELAKVLGIAARGITTIDDPVTLNDDDPGRTYQEEEVLRVFDKAIAAEGKGDLTK